MDELSSRGSVRPSGIRFHLPGLIPSKKEGKGMQDLLRRTNFSQYAIYVGFLLIFVIFSVALHNDGFLTRFNLFNIVQQAAPITIMSIGTVFVLTAGEIDLSIGSIVAVTALIAAVLLRSQAWPIAVAGGLFIGALIGALNGALVSYGRLPSFLITLATMGVFQGIARRLTDLQPVPIQNETFNAIFGSGDVAGILLLSSGPSSPRSSDGSFSTKHATEHTSMPRAIARMPHGPPASRCCGCVSASWFCRALWRRWPASSTLAAFMAPATILAKPIS